jgi:hypothetical protein
MSFLLNELRGPRVYEKTNLSFPDAVIMRAAANNGFKIQHNSRQQIRLYQLRIFQFHCHLTNVRA